MKKLFLIVVSVLLSLQSFSQVGVITIEKDAEEVPMGHWYVCKDKTLDNHAFYYDEQKLVEVKVRILIFLKVKIKMVIYIGK